MKKKLVVVAMSGGVDSSVTAYLLQKQGYEVIGLTMQLWPRAEERPGGCCGLESIEDAKKVANTLGIPHYAVNFRNIFKEKVITPFTTEYQRGRTPNPCIRCNQYIKFEALLMKAKELGADYLATGHYAQIEYAKESKRFLLKKGVDSLKDQSYFLYIMTQDQLKSALMPLGNYCKDKVRQIARQLNLPVASRPESQEICFIPDNNYGRFLQESLPESAKPGPIIDKEGKVIGEHPGIIFYTIGQRRGIGIPDREPLYVISIDVQNNSIGVGKEKDLYSDELIADELNFITREKLKEPLKVQAKIRYLHDPQEAVATPLEKDKVQVKFKQPQRAITPGQAVVFYDQDTVIGGGTIT